MAVNAYLCVLCWSFKIVRTLYQKLSLITAQGFHNMNIMTSLSKANFFFAIENLPGIWLSVYQQPVSNLRDWRAFMIWWRVNYLKMKVCLERVWYVQTLVGQRYGFSEGRRNHLTDRKRCVCEQATENISLSHSTSSSVNCRCDCMKRVSLLHEKITSTFCQS